MHLTKIAIKTLYKSLFFAVIFLFITIVLIFLYLNYQISQKYNNRLLPGIVVNGVDLSGSNFNQIKEYVDGQNKRLERDVLITLEYPDSELATFSAQMLRVKYNDRQLFSKTYPIGRNLDNPLDLISAIYQILLGQKIHLTVMPEYSISSLEENLKVKKKTSYVAPKNALFKVVNNRVVAFQIDKPGSSLNIKPALSQAKQYFETDPGINKNQLKISVEAKIMPAKFSISEANNFGIVEEIGKGVSNFAHSAPPRIFNIRLVSSRINGTLVPRGEIFSFNGSAGEISSRTGYQSGYAIISGATVLSDGGGVCQESTTIFRAAINAGLPIVAWKNHSYRVRYYENDSKPGFDATVYAPRVDFKFKNDTPAHILIQSSIEGTILTVALYGKRDNREVSISLARVWGVVPPPEPLYKDDPTLPRGTTKQVDYTAWGAKAAFDYKVTRGNEILQDRTFTSVYQPWQAVFLVGTQ